MMRYDDSEGGFQPAGGMQGGGKPLGRGPTMPPAPQGRGPMPMQQIGRMLQQRPGGGGALQQAMQRMMPQQPKRPQPMPQGNAFGYLQQMMGGGGARPPMAQAPRPQMPMRPNVQMPMGMAMQRFRGR